MLSSYKRSAAGDHPNVHHSCFKTLLFALLDAKGDLLKINKKYKGPLKCAIKETYPNLLLTDGSYFISAYLTKEAYDRFKQKCGKFGLSQLRDWMLKVNKWSLELAQVNTSEVFTSYQNLEMRLIIYDFELKSDAAVDLPNKYPMNIFRDDDVRTHMLHFLTES